MPEQAIARSCYWSTSAKFVLLFVASCIWYSGTPGPPVAEGDSAQYLTYINEGRVFEIPAHAGYLVAGWLAVNSMPFLPAENAMLVLSVASGSLGVCCVFWVVRYYTNDDLASALAALGLLTAGNYWYTATIIEVYIVQSGALLAALAFWLAARPSGPDAEASSAGRCRLVLCLGATVALFAFACSISPASLAFLPMLLFSRQPGVSWQTLVKIGVAVAACGLVAGIVGWELLLKHRPIFVRFDWFSRSVVLAGVSAGVMVMATVGLTFGAGRGNDTMGIVERRFRLVAVGCFLTVLAYLPFGLLISTWPFLPVYGVLAIGFGLAIHRFRSSTTPAGRAANIASATATATVALMMIGLCAADAWHDSLSTRLGNWFESVPRGWPVVVAGIGFAAALVFGVVAHQRSRCSLSLPVWQLACAGFLFVVTHAMMGAVLVVAPKVRSIDDFYEACQLLADRQPKSEAIVGTYDSLMLYDYAQHGQAQYPTSHFDMVDANPQAFSQVLSRQSALYLLGRRMCCQLERKQIPLSQYRVSPLDKRPHVLWVVESAGTP